MITIEKCSNGYLFYVNRISGDEIEEVDSMVFEEFGNTKKHVVSLLYSLLEALGELGSKHDEERVRVIRVNREGEEIIN